VAIRICDLVAIWITDLDSDLDLDCALVGHALVEVCTVPVLLVIFRFINEYLGVVVCLQRSANGLHII